MSCQAVLLPKWSSHGRIFLAKGQLDKSYSFLTMANYTTVDCDSFFETDVIRNGNYSNSSIDKNTQSLLQCQKNSSQMAKVLILKEPFLRKKLWFFKITFWMKICVRLLHKLSYQKGICCPHLLQCSVQHQKCNLQSQKWKIAFPFLFWDTFYCEDLISSDKFCVACHQGYSCHNALRYIRYVDISILYRTLPQEGAIHKLHK